MNDKNCIHAVADLFDALEPPMSSEYHQDSSVVEDPRQWEKSLQSDIPAGGVEFRMPKIHVGFSQSTI